MRIVLASGSPRRRALLAALGIEIEVIPSGAQEIDEGDTPERIVIENAKRKRDDVVGGLDSPALVIAADTLVFLDGRVLSKPNDIDDARAMLRRLSGRTHDVLTGIAVTDAHSGRSAEGYERTGVTFCDLSDAEIGHFVHAVKPLDRAGAYTVDGPGSLLVARYDGCYQNVLGLPMVRLQKLLLDLGHDLFELMDGPRSVFL
ncbi:MAG: septum formation protein Maf [Candidatus Hydrogenedentes bacterium]|nr:septum formation protein Maf [Candidatus Hydrogenedentota bacterium]